MLDIVANENDDDFANSPVDSNLPRRRLLNVLVVTVGFCLLFCAFNTLQAYVSSLLPGSLGFQSLVVLYVSYEVFLVVAPYLCDRLTDVGALILGGTCYVVYIGSLITMNAVAIIFASIVIGFGAAILWVAQGSAITRWSTDATRGKYAGIFWGGFQVSAVAGPLASYTILSTVSTDMEVTVLFAIFAAIAVASVLVFACHCCPCIRITPPKRRPTSTDGSAESCCKSIWAPVLRGLELCKTRDVALMLAACVFTGVETTFSSGEYFKLVGLLPCDTFSDNETAYVVFIATHLCTCLL